MQKKCDFYAHTRTEKESDGEKESARRRNREIEREKLAEQKQRHHVLCGRSREAVLWGPLHVQEQACPVRSAGFQSPSSSTLRFC